MKRFCYIPQPIVLGCLCFSFAACEQEIDSQLADIAGDQKSFATYVEAFHAQVDEDGHVVIPNLESNDVFSEGSSISASQLINMDPSETLFVYTPPEGMKARFAPLTVAKPSLSSTSLNLTSLNLEKELSSSQTSDGHVESCQQLKNYNSELPKMGDLQQATALSGSNVEVKYCIEISLGDLNHFIVTHPYVVEEAEILEEAIQADEPQVAKALLMIDDAADTPVNLSQSVQVAIVDDSQQVVESYGQGVSLELLKIIDEEETVFGHANAIAANGVARFSLQIPEQGQYVFVFRDEAKALAPLRSQAFRIVDKQQAQLQFAALPSVNYVGMGLKGLQVVMVDGEGQRLSQFDGVVTLSLSSAPAGASLFQQSAAAKGGVADFSQATVSAIGMYELQASADGVASVVSEPMKIQANNPPYFSQKPVNSMFLVEDGAGQEVNFAVADGEENIACSHVQASSSSPLFSSGSLLIRQGDSTNCSLTMKAKEGLSGKAEVVLRLKDSGGLVVEETIEVVVKARPRIDISTIISPQAKEGTTIGPLEFSLSILGNQATVGCSSVTSSVADISLVKSAVVSTSGDKCFITIEPQGEQIGTTTISLVATSSQGVDSEPAQFNIAYQANVLPTLTTFSGSIEVYPQTSFELSYENLLAISDAADADGDSLSFRIEGIKAGLSVLHSGEAVTVGSTEIGPGDSLIVHQGDNSDGNALLSFVVSDGDGVSSPGVWLDVTMQDNTVANQISGTIESDQIYGGQDADNLSGGLGSDIFLYKSMSEIGVGLGNRDVIVDFSPTEDRIQLALSSMPANVYILGTAPFTGLGLAEIRWEEEASHNISVRFDMDGDGSYEGEILVQAKSGESLTVGDLGLDQFLIDGKKKGITQLAVVTQPVDSYVNVNQSMAVQFQDSDGQGVGVSGLSVSLALSSGSPGGKSIISGSTLVATDASGIASFSGLQMNSGSADPFGFTLTAGLLSVSSASFYVHVGPATQLVFTAQPSDVEEYLSQASPITVEARDGSGNRVTQFTSNIKLQIANDPSTGAATLSGTTTAQAVAGVATFQNFSLDVPGVGYSIRAIIEVDSSLPVISESFEVTAIDTVGGTGADTLNGNVADNVLIGGYGGDVLDGKEGNDTLIGDNVVFSDTSNIAFWLDPAEESTVTLDSNGAVAEILDKVGKTIKFEDIDNVGNITDHPVIDSTTMTSGHKGLSFNGSQKLFALYTQLPGTIFVAAHPTSGGCIIGGRKNAAGDGVWRVGHAGGTTKVYAQYTWEESQKSQYGALYVANESVVNAYKYDLGQNKITVSRNNVASTGNMSPITHYSVHNHTIIGACPWSTANGTHFRYNGVIAEILVYTSLKSGDDYDAVQEYLSLKHGIALDGLTLAPDRLTGGLGADIFVHTNASHSGVGLGQRDEITDFSIAEGDKLQIEGFSELLHVIPVSSPAATTAPFTASTRAELGFYMDGSHAVAAFDWNGDGVTDSELQLTGLNLDSTPITMAQLIIDKAVMPGSDDTITGVSDRSNLLYGGPGGDTIVGGDLADTLVGDKANFNYTENMGLWIDPSRSDLVAESGGAISSITGKSPEAVVYSQGDSSMQPLLVALDNGQMAMNFTSSNKHKLHSNYIHNPIDFFVAYSVSDAPVNNQVYSIRDSSHTYNNSSGFGLLGAETGSVSRIKMRLALESEFIPRSGDIVTFDEMHLGEFRLDLTSQYFSLRLDGQTEHTKPFTSTGLGTYANDSYIGCGAWKTTGTHDHHEGDIAEIISYTESLNDVQRTEVREYLSLRYAVPIAGQNMAPDILTGGGGADTFLHTLASYTGLGAGNRDVIKDFSKVEGDIIKISGFPQNLVFNPGSGAPVAPYYTGVPEVIAYYDSSVGTIIGFDLNGDAIEDQQLLLENYNLTTYPLTTAHIVVE